MRGGNVPPFADTGLENTWPTKGLSRASVQHGGTIAPWKSGVKNILTHLSLDKWLQSIQAIEIPLVLALSVLARFAVHQGLLRLVMEAVPACWLQRPCIHSSPRKS